MEMENEIILAGVKKELFTSAILQSNFELDETGFDELRTAQDDDIFVNWKQRKVYRIRYAADKFLVTLFVLDEEHPIPVLFSHMPLFI